MATYKKPASMAVSAFLDKPGWYHFLVNEVDEQPLNKSNGVLDGIRPVLTCLGGTEASQEKRTFDPLLFNPAESHKDGGEFATRVHLRLADACNFPLPAAGEDVEIDWTKAKGNQIVACVKPGKDPKFLEIDGAHIYHVDDPEVAAIPKNEKMLGLLPASKRRAAKSTTDAKSAAGKSTASTPPTTVTQPAKEFDPDEL